MTAGGAVVDTPWGGRALRVAIVHSFYRSANPSGENQVVRAEVAALQRAGVEVTLVASHTDELIGGPLDAARTALRVATGRGRDPLEDLAVAQPDVVHVHNLFPNLGRTWVRSVQVPVVHTLHNFRPLCAAATLYRDGAICTRCPDGDPGAGLRYGCYRDSRTATLPLTIANWRGPAGDPLLSCADRVLALSDRSMQLYRDAGVPASRLRRWENFLPDDADVGRSEPSTSRDGWLVVGRLTPEKGVRELVAAWPDDHHLTVVGDGEQLEEIRAAARSRPIEVVGRVDRAEVIERMRRATGLVVPSRWYEVQPMTYLEALAAGLPSVAFRPNAVAELVQRDGTGVAVDWDEDLGPVLDAAAGTFAGLAEHCRAVFLRTHTESAHVDRTLALYRELVG